MADLTTLASVKAWLGINSVDASRDTVLERLIRAQSRYIQAWLSREILSKPYTEARNGFGAGEGRFMMSFANDPVSSFTSLSVNGISIPASPDGGIQAPGYGFDSDAVWIAKTTSTDALFSLGGFSKGQRNVILSYIGGFLVLPLGQASTNSWLPSAEVHTIPATPFQVTPDLLWLADNGVNFVATGVALIAVAGSPAAGQYSVSTINGIPGVYTFNAGDVGKAVALSYSYVPSDIEQACIELIGLRWKEKDRIGVVSLAVGTESTTFFQKDMPAQVMTDLQQYKRVFSL